MMTPSTVCFTNPVLLDTSVVFLCITINAAVMDTLCGLSFAT